MSKITRAFIYARKSTDTEDRQIFSIDHQLKELRELAVKQNIEVVTEFTENRTAKSPGRPIFNQMISRLKKGEASCILAWHPDRLARNAVDGGLVMHLIDTKSLADLKFVTFWFEPTPQGMLMLSIAFGMSKYYTDSLSQGVKRAYRRRVEDGRWPRRPPIGYLFDRNTRTVILDPIRAPLVRQVFDLYAGGDCTLHELTRTMNDRGLRGFPRKKTKRSGLPLSCSQLHYLLQNPFYAGMMRYQGELFEGRHDRIAPLTLFDRCQIVLAQRGRRNPTELKPCLYRKLFRCGECGCTITNETQKGFNYLRCTKRKGNCSQSYLREESAAEQIASIIRGLIVPQDRIDTAVSKLQSAQAKEAGSVSDEIKTFTAQLTKYDDKYRRLTEVYVDGTMPAADFHKTKEKLIRQRRLLTEKITFLKNNPKTLLEPAIRFIRGLIEPRKLIEGGNAAQQRDFIKKVGSNFFLQGGNVLYTARGPWKPVVGQRFSGARVRATVGGGGIADAIFSARCCELESNRTSLPTDDIVVIFKDNPTWA